MIKPLNGISVLDMTEGVAGRCAASLLGDLGAAVIKVERPEGDWGRVGDDLQPEQARYLPRPSQDGGKYARQLCDNGPLALRAVKEQFGGTEDAKEGPRAFAEKRKPSFKAR